MIKEINYEGFGRCLEITNGKVDLLVTLDLGPRIIRYGFCGKENMMFEDKNREISLKSKELEETFGEGSQWFIYGGHRLWVSPEYITTYYPDNEKVTYKETKRGGILFTPPTQRINKLLCEFEVILDENTADVSIIHRVTNISGVEKEFSLWCLTVLDKGGVEIFEWNTYTDGFLSNRNLIIWPYTNMADKRAYFGKEYVIIKQDEKAEIPFKIGTDNRKGWAAYINKGAAFIKRFEHNPNAAYPDNGCSFETYTNAVMMECETIGELKKVKNGEMSTYTEKWALIDGIKAEEIKDEQSAKSFAEKYLK